MKTDTNTAPLTYRTECADALKYALDSIEYFMNRVRNHKRLAYYMAGTESLERLIDAMDKGGRCSTIARGGFDLDCIDPEKAVKEKMQSEIDHLCAKIEELTLAQIANRRNQQTHLSF